MRRNLSHTRGIFSIDYTNTMERLPSMNNLNITIHRGSDQIGGTCIHVETENTSVLLDAGEPLSDNAPPLPAEKLKADAVLISHPHQDHYGMIDQLPKTTPVYMGAVAQELIKATRVFIRKPYPEVAFKNLKSTEPIQIGDITVTAIPVDHSAVDAYSLLLEAHGKRILYSGDFRGHGRKRKLFERFLTNPPKDIDVLLMEGTMLQRSNSEFPDEESVEERIVGVLKEQTGMTFLVSSSQTIDRIVSAYRACLKQKKTLVLDFYTAWVLEKASALSKRIPQMDWNQVKIYADHSHNERLQDNRDYFGNFINRAYRNRVTMEELERNPEEYTWLIKTSHAYKVERFRKLCQVNIIYSQWLGYIDEARATTKGEKSFAQYRKADDINFVYAHTSGHAVVEDLQAYARAVRAKKLIPVHTEFPDDYAALFEDVYRLEDGMVLAL
jgi:ribonuclease J